MALYDRAEKRILEYARDIAASLGRNNEGFHVCDELLGGNWAHELRAEAEAMFEAGKFEQSYSMVADDNGILQRVNKPGVFALELNGHEQVDANHLLHYTAALVRTLPACLNRHLQNEGLALSAKTYGTKLAVTKGGAKYPKHVDNVGLPDRRKVTAIYYFNPGWIRGNGGELRLFGGNGLVEDVAPTSDRLVVFWSDQVSVLVVFWSDQVSVLVVFWSGQVSVLVVFWSDQVSVQVVFWSDKVSVLVVFCWIR
jgi:hypothetical protein